MVRVLIMIVMVTSEASDGMVVFRDTLMEEVSGMFFLILLTSLSLCPHSYGGRFWSVLPHCSLRHPCVLTHFVIPVISLTSSSL